jgi:hypothetical protein
MDSKPFNSFLLQEGLRQDALIHANSSQLGTKIGLFMVFAAFVFTAESTLAGTSGIFGFKLPHWGVGGALLLSLAGIVMLIRCAFLEDYKYPAVLRELREQANIFFKLPGIQELPEEDKTERFQGKFVDSLARCIDTNFDLNVRIGKNLQRASWFIGGSVFCLFASLLWVLGKNALTVFQSCHYSGFSWR